MAECCTEQKVINYCYKWKIKQFSMRLEKIPLESNVMSILKSSSFPLPVGNKSPFYFEIRLYRNSNYTSTEIAIRLVCDKVDTVPTSVSLQYFFVNAKSEHIHLKEQKIPELSIHVQNKVYITLYDAPKLLKEADIYLPNDELTIICQMDITTDITTISVAPHIPHVTIHNFVNDFAEFLKDNEFTDVTFEICDKKIRAHRAILAARSPVFSAMFKHPMKEQNSNVVKIEDVEPEIFEAMLEYVYTNDVIDIDCTATDLLPVADKYDLKELKKLCGASLCKNVTVDNVAEIYILADRHNVEELLEYMQHFMGINLVDVMKTAGYRTIETDSQLLATFLRKLMMPKSPNN